MSSKMKYNDVLMSPLEVVHVVDVTGVRCGDCKAQVSAGHVYPGYAHVVVVDRDPAASWLTTRNITCGR